MRTIALICITILSLLIIACPMPQVGGGKSRDTLGTGDQGGAPSTAGTISVINDTERNQAVYINETGVHFDVVAPEYPGGPLVACVEVDAFTMVPQSTDADPDALPVKALVTGMRNDGMPGVWEIHADDTIDLPQPEQTTDNTARCIVGGDMNSLPDSVQLRFGWTFQTVKVSADGKMIIGKALNKHGATIGGVQILPNTPIGVYWRVYSLPYSRFCIVSAPHIIGTFTPQTLPPKWSTRGHDLTDVLRQLKLLFTGTLGSYLTEPSDVRLDVPAGLTAAAAQSAGVYIVTGLDEFKLPATATIDKSSTITIAETLPDLELGTVQVPTSPQDFGNSWTVNAAVTNMGNYDAKAVTLSYYLSTSSVFSTSDSTVTKPIGAPLTLGTVAMGVTVSGNTSISTTVAQVGFDQSVGKTVTYYVYAVVGADPTQNFNLDLTTSVSGSFTVTRPDITPPPPTLKVTLSSTQNDPVFLNGSWSFTIATTVDNAVTTPDRVDLYVKNDATPTVAESFLRSVTFGGQVSVNSVAVGNPIAGTVSEFDGKPGLHHIRAVAFVGSQTAEASFAVPVKYDRIILDTYNPLAPVPTSPVYGIDSMDLIGPQGNILQSDDGSSNPDPSETSFAYVDCTLGLAPGDYYVSVHATNPGDSGPYAIRVLTASDTIPRDTSWYFDSVFGSGDTLPSNPIIHIGEKLNRFIAANTADMIHLVLP